MHESQKVVSKSFMIRNFIDHLRVNACISYRIMCLSWLVFVPETVYIWIALFFKPKMDLISTIIVFGFLEIQSNNVPVDDKPYQGIF